MKARLTSFWKSLAARERNAVILLAALLVASAYWWLVQTAGRAREQLSASLTTLHAQSNRLERDARELAQLRAAPLASAPQIDLRTLVQARIEGAGLARLVVRLDSPDNQLVQIEFGAIPFTDWLNWVTALQVQQVRLETCRVQALSTPGLVNVTATLARIRAQ